MTLVELVIGKFPFPPNGQPLSVFELLEYIVKEPVPTLPPGQCSKEFEEFIAESLIKDQNKRPGPSELLVNLNACANIILETSILSSDIAKTGGFGCIC